MYGSRKCNYDLCEKCVYRQLNYKVELISYKPQSRNEVYYLLSTLLDIPRRKADDNISDTPYLLKENIEEEDAIEIAAILQTIGEDVEMKVTQVINEEGK